VVVVVTRQFRATAPSVHTLSEFSANGLFLREASLSKSSTIVQFGQEICPPKSLPDFGRRFRYRPVPYRKLAEILCQAVCLNVKFTGFGKLDFQVAGSLRVIVAVTSSVS
jgi:hypothetical protein